jgi:hypothetical protein
MGNLKQLGIAFIRTSLVPPVGGFVATWLLNKGINISGNMLYAAIAIILSGIWYLLLHAIEVLAKNPKVKRWAGIFLGYPVEVSYEKRA